MWCELVSILWLKISRIKSSLKHDTYFDNLSLILISLFLVSSEKNSTDSPEFLLNEHRYDKKTKRMLNAGRLKYTLQSRDMTVDLLSDGNCISIYNRQCRLIESPRVRRWFKLLPSCEVPSTLSLTACSFPERLEFMRFQRCDIRAGTRRVKWFVRRSRCSAPHHEGIKTYFRSRDLGKVF